MPRDIGTTRFSRMLERAFAAKASGETGSLIEDVMPVAEVLDPTQPDLRVLRGETLWSEDVGVGPTAGEYGIVTLCNPAGSGHLLTVEAIMMHNLDAAPMFFAISIVPTIATAGGALVARDTRLMGARSVGVVQFRTQPAVPSSGWGAPLVPPNSTFSMPPGWEFVISPGWELKVGQQVVNKTILIGYAWSERQAESEELQRVTL